MKKIIVFILAFAVASFAAPSDKVAAYLHYSGDVSYKAQKYEEALQNYKNATVIWRELAKTNPVAFNKYLAITLCSTGSVYLNTQKYTEALQSYEEALGIWRELARTERIDYKTELGAWRVLLKADPSAFFNSFVATTLDNIGNSYSKMQKYEDALLNYKSALVVWHQLDKANPNVFNGHIAATMRNIGILYENGKQYKDALQYYKDSLKIFEQLPKIFEHLPNHNYDNQIKELRERIGSLEGQ
jgi:nephrocystin-3